METFAFLEPDIGEKEDTDMSKNRIIYAEAPQRVSRALATGKIVADFLPPPEKLVRKEPKVKITITLNSGSVSFFKKFARENNVKYQTMINEVLDRYVQKYKDRKIV
jgi:uncharacterized protein (DUF4415 family)